MIVELLANATDLPTSGTNLGSATFVRLVNTHTAVMTVTVQTSAGSGIGTVEIAPNQALILKKNPTDLIFASGSSHLSATVVKVITTAQPKSFTKMGH